jgi:uncharacterized membrane protein YadS
MASIPANAVLALLLGIQAFIWTPERSGRGIIICAAVILGISIALAPANMPTARYHSVGMMCRVVSEIVIYAAMLRMVFFRKTLQ